MNNKGKLTKKIKIEGRIIALSGLHIGGSNTGMSIGGADATVVRNPLTNEPYIPGSSLKGKMRSLLERLNGRFGEEMSGTVKFGPFTNEINDPIVKTFGTTPEKLEAQQKKDKNLLSQPVSRLIVRDGRLAGIEKEGKFKNRKEGGVSDLLNAKTTDMPYTEVKTEVVIDRITSAAMPRQLERVPAGTVFEMNLILNLYDEEEKLENLIPLLNLIFRGLCLVQNDFLGGKGSRGSGEVRIEVVDVVSKTKEDYEGMNEWQPFGEGMKLIPTELKPYLKPWTTAT